MPENYTLVLAQTTARIAYFPPLICTWYTPHQNDIALILFAGADVML
jgi:hypothetical protein